MWILAPVILFGFFYLQFKAEKNPAWGVNFSIPHAQYLGLDWKKAYLEILQDLGPRRLRIPAYWELVEPQQGQFSFSDIDFLVSEAGKRGARIILVVGYKQPRWPECHEPEWVRIQNEKIKNQNLLDYIKTVIEHYKDSPTVYAWQVENEPYFPYGPDCGSVPADLYKRELALVKSLDTRPLIVTDSGEKGAWLPTAWAGGDIFGSTMYRKVYHHKKQKYVSYAIPPALYRIKAGLVKAFSNIDEFIGVELQAEPWFATDVYQTSWEKQAELMNPQIFSDNAEYARRVGFAENYFWGVEWWYWAKNQGHPEMWEAAKSIINNQ